ncbi:MAG: sensor histidine kinase [Candidatus Odinarchaeota archaeon]
MSDFAHFIVHDLSNGLSTIVDHIRLFQMKQDGSCLEKIVNHTMYLQKQHDHSLKLADAGTTIEKTSNMDLNVLVDRIAETTIPKNTLFTYDVLPVLPCDPKKLIQVFQNLFENAVIHGEPENITVKLKMSENHIILSVMNDGKMIAPEKLEKVFKRGYTTKKGNLGRVLPLSRNWLKLTAGI